METRDVAAAVLAGAAGLAGVYGLVVMPRGEGDGVLGAIADVQETLEWTVNATALNSAAVLALGAALVLLLARD